MHMTLDPLSADLVVGGYLRKSAVVEEGTRALSIESQEARYRRWCAREGLTPDPAHIYKDNASAWHGSSSKRDAFAQALAAMDAGELHVLWCPSVDRLSRGGAGVVMTLIDKGCRFYFDHEGLDSADQRNRMIIAMFAEMARERSDTLSENVRRVKSDQRDMGAWLSAPPYGTKVVGHKQTRRLVPDPDTWPVIRTIFEMAAGGHTPSEIAERLNASHIPAPGAGRKRKGKPNPAQWCRMTVYIMIHNPVYEGWMVVRSGHRRLRYIGPGGRPVRCFAEGAETIPAELAHKARTTKARAPQGLRERGKAKYMLTGLLHCGGCGARMPVNNVWHRCGTDVRGLSCPSPAKVRREVLEREVFDAWMSRIINAGEDDPMIVELSRRWAAQTSPEETAELQEAREAVRIAEERVQRVMDDRAAGLYRGPAEGQFHRHHAAAMAEWEAAKARLEELDTGGVDHAGAVIEAYLSGEADRRELLRLAVDRIDVQADGAVAVHWAGSGAGVTRLRLPSAALPATSDRVTK